MLMVVKVGSNMLREEGGDIDLGFMAKLAREIRELLKAGHRVVLVSSGAVLCGVRRLNLGERPREVLLKQAVASVGQTTLMHTYEMVFSNYGLVAAQVLLTADVFRDKNRKETVVDVVNKIIELGAVPIVNENDAVGISELLFGDNDFLSVYTAHALDANLIVLFSSAGGLQDFDGKIVSLVEDVDEVMKFVRASNSEFGTGGMRSKLNATKIATSLGIKVVITGKEDSLLEIKEGKTKGTVFLPAKRGLKGRKSSLALYQETKGALQIDSGAYRAIKDGKSLLAVGIKKVEGSFKRGDMVVIYSPEGYIAGKGKVNFSSEDIKKVINKKGSEVKRILNSQKEEVIHADNLAVF
ncbi:MAG: glutamate 5-kinase [Aquificaceae bacterium]|nr:glutamate 5-kinase [Aquificaceae bacterium]MDW8237608.1 glutamate 5-kinase [Aquificaceae bacterium]